MGIFGLAFDVVSCVVHIKRKKMLAVEGNRVDVQHTYLDAAEREVYSVRVPLSFVFDGGLLNHGGKFT